MNPKVINVATQTPYQVKVGHGVLKEFASEMRTLFPPCKIMVVVDANTAPLAAAHLAALANSGFLVSQFVAKTGEDAKTLAEYIRLLDALCGGDFCRSDVLVAFGGGTVGDLTGFAAATYLRGISFVQVPTTLLAMVDSSVGGKTGLNLAMGKNLVGAFYQPKLVLADLDTLASLPNSEWDNGMGEVAKTAILAGGKSFQLCLEGAKQHLHDVVAQCIQYKTEIVEEDPNENGLRRLLNLGHTLAHAIETHSRHTIPHGKAVAMGLSEMLAASKRQQTITQADADEIARLISNLCGKQTLPYPMHELLPYLVRDKKREGGTLHAVVILGVGNCKIVPFPFDEFVGYLS